MPHEEDSTATAGFEGGERGPEPRNVGRLCLEAGKGKDTDAPRESLYKKCSPLTA